MSPSLSLSEKSRTGSIAACSFISRYVLQVRPKNATMIMAPPTMAAKLKGSPVIIQSTMATMKMVSSAATDDRTGEVSEIRTRNEPLKVALESTASRMSQHVEAAGISNFSMLSQSRIGRGSQSTVRVKSPIKEPKVLAKIIPLPGEQPSGGQA